MEILRASECHQECHIPCSDIIRLATLRGLYKPSMYSFIGLLLPQLVVLYSLGTSVPQTAWTIVGVGLRFAVEIGVHRRKAEGHIMTMEDELKKRAFWYEQVS